MAVLSELPPPPDSHIIDLAQGQFFTTFKRHIFLSSLVFPAPPMKNSVPPYLEIGFACLAHVVSKSMADSGDVGSNSSVSVQSSASDLFLAGDGFWGVMMEVDNREARLLEAILAVSPTFPSSFLHNGHPCLSALLGQSLCHIRYT